MSMVTIRTRLLRWGNSYGLRLSRGDVERLRLRPESTIEVKVDVTPGERIRPAEARTFSLGGDASSRHDELFAQAALEDHLETLRERDDGDDA